MNKKNNIFMWIGILGIISLIVIAVIVFYNPFEKEETVKNVEDKTDKNVINEIKSKINATGDSNIYQIEEEYDGRKILQIKPNIQFETALAGILKGEKPSKEEVQELLQNRPTKSGIWISKSSRDKFLKLLQDNGINEYRIQEDGYLSYNNSIYGDKLYVIDISGTSYVRDEISGEIVEYPFEKMEPYQILDIYNNESSVILEVTTNEKGKLSNQEILKEILANIK